MNWKEIQTGCLGAVWVLFVFWGSSTQEEEPMQLYKCIAVAILKFALLVCESLGKRPLRSFSLWVAGGRSLILAVDPSEYNLVY